MFDIDWVASAAVDAYDLRATANLDTVAALARQIRAKAAELRELLQRIKMHVDDQHLSAKLTSDIDETQRLQDADQYRWIAGRHRANRPVEDQHLCACKGQRVSEARQWSTRSAWREDQVGAWVDASRIRERDGPSGDGPRPQTNPGHAPGFC